MKKLTKALLAIGTGAVCVATGGLVAPAIGAAIGLTGTAAAHVAAGTAVAAQAAGAAIAAEKAKEKKEK